MPTCFKVNCCTVNVGNKVCQGDAPTWSAGLPPSNNLVYSSSRPRRGDAQRWSNCLYPRRFRTDNRWTAGKVIKKAKKCSEVGSGNTGSLPTHGGLCNQNRIESPKHEVSLVGMEALAAIRMRLSHVHFKQSRWHAINAQN